MLDQFLRFVLRQLRERLIALKSERPRQLPAEYDLASRAIAAEIDRIVSDLDELLDNHDAGILVSSTVVSEYRILISEATRLETVFMPALANVTDRDIELSRLLRQLHQEINFPLHCPAVTRSSQDLHWIDSGLHLIGVPYRDDHSPLAVPILFHELGHLLFAESNDRQVKPFDDAMLSIGCEATKFFRNREISAGRRRGQTFAAARLKAWRHLWVKNWIEELCCDAFGAVVGGPAYAWSFIHSTMAFGTDAFELPSLEGDNEHPADAARVKVVLKAMQQSGLTAEALEVQAFWTEASSSIGGESAEEFEQCYPDELISLVAERVVSATEQVGCHQYGSEGNGVCESLTHFWNESLAGRIVTENWCSKLLDCAAKD